MRLASVSLPKLHLASHEQRLDFSLEGSLKLRFPNGTRLPKTSGDLLKLAKEKHLWIARTGSCFFQLDVAVQGEAVEEEEQIARVVEWVWDRVGVTLRAQERGVSEPTGRIAFSIQHPDLSSALVTRKDAYTAEFDSVTCRVDLTAMQNEPSKKKRSMKRKRDSRPDEDTTAEQPDGVSFDDDYLACLSPEDQRAIDDFIQSLQMVPPQQEEHGFIPKASPDSQIIGKLEFSDCFQQLFEAALEILVLGSAKKHKGIAVVDCSRVECLTRLAAAVFSMPYLKTVSDRAALLPTIATSLARMINAESPSLRQKAASFAARVAGKKCKQSDRVIRGIEQSTWHVVLSTIKTIKTPARPRKGGHEVEGAFPTIESRPGLSLSRPSVLLPAIDREKSDEGASTTIGTTLHDQMGNKEPMPLFFRQRSQEYLESVNSLPKTQTADTPISLVRKDELEAELDHVFFDRMEKGFMAKAAMLNHDPLPFDIESLATFDEWLCTSESGSEYLGNLRPTSGDVDVSFYKSWEK